MPESLLVFSDDWGRHPSSCQHLIGELLPEIDVTWVNTIGMRPPRLDLLTVKRVWGKVGDWSQLRQADATGKGVTNHTNLTVIDTKMWPWMNHRWDRWLNQRLLMSQLASSARSSVAVTTIPIVADLVGHLPVRRWIYYCVDDFSVWPGLDGPTLGRMEDELLPKMDLIVAASDSLAAGIAARGFQADVITHGVDLEFWSAKPHDLMQPTMSQIPDKSPLVLFWGVVDQRMNADWVLELADQMSSGEIWLVGPKQNPDSRLSAHPRVKLPGAIPYTELPFLAQRADVLIMPYADLAVTRAMQPLKLKEYLATMRPVVAATLPPVLEWSDCLDAVDTVGDFVDRTLFHLQNNGGLSLTMRKARHRLEIETWANKASRFQQMLFR
ncbi:glycosyltransferase [Allorhodopirellula solitaria]|nr:glycosyltransferase [Allorhodopirellula solitaria]